MHGMKWLLAEPILCLEAIILSCLFHRNKNTENICFVYIVPLYSTTMLVIVQVVCIMISDPWNIYSMVARLLWVHPISTHSWCIHLKIKHRHLWCTHAAWLVSRRNVVFKLAFQICSICHWNNQVSIYKQNSTMLWERFCNHSSVCSDSPHDWAHFQAPLAAL